jgi:capsular polysaccharide transport system permease protein
LRLRLFDESIGRAFPNDGRIGWFLKRLGYGVIPRVMLGLVHVSGRTGNRSSINHISELRYLKYGRFAITGIKYLSPTSVPVPKRRFASARAIMALILREMSTTYGRSPGGYIWAILEPVAGIAVFSLVISLIARNPPLGTSFILFYATGFLPLTLYQSVVSKVGSAIRFSRPLLAYPNVTYVDAILSRLILEAMTQVLIFAFILFGTILAFSLHVSIDFGTVALAFVMGLALGTGIGLINSFLISVFPLWQFIWAVLNRPMFIISGIFFLIDPLPEKYRTILMYNPVAHVVSEMRNGFYPTYDAVYVSVPYVFTVSAVSAVLGLVLLHRYHGFILDEGA